VLSFVDSELGSGPCVAGAAFTLADVMMTFPFTTLVFAFAIGTTVSIAHGQVYKCTDSSGKTTYSDSACDNSAKPLKLPDDPKGNTTNPHMCAQLQDEAQRLAAEADRDAKRGRTESTDSAMRRKAVTARYEARCAGISRSEPKAK
jgi:hypothetical protein